MQPLTYSTCVETTPTVTMRSSQLGQIILGSIVGISAAFLAIWCTSQQHTTDLWASAPTTNIKVQSALATSRVLVPHVVHRAAISSDSQPEMNLRQAEETVPQVSSASFGMLVGAVTAIGAMFWTAHKLFQGQPTEIAMMTAAGKKDMEVDYDALIQQLLATDEKTMKLAIAQNMPVLSPAFFQKLEDVIAKAAPADKKKYEELGDRVMEGMKQIIAEAQAKVQEQGVRITGLIGIFSEEDGTINLPLPKEKVTRLREVVRGDLAGMSNDVFVNATLAFMAKAAQDKKAELIEVLQRVMQVYAAESLLIMCPHGGEGAQPENIMVWNMLLNSEFDEWEAILRKEFFSPGSRSVDSFLTMLDAGVGAVVYEQSKGAIQQLLAQYVYQIIQRIDKLKEATK